MLKDIGRTARMINAEGWSIDGHYGNEKLLAFMNMTDKETPRIRQLCGNHRVALVEGEIKLLLGATVVPKMFSMASFLRSGSFWTRLLGAVRSIIDDRVVFAVGQDLCPAWAAYAEEVMSYMCRQHRKFARAWIDRDRPQDAAAESKRMKQYREAWERHLQLWRCHWSVDADSDITVFVDEEVNRKSYIDEMAISFSQTIVRTMMVVPEHGKWTLFTPACDFLYGGYACCNMLECLLGVKVSQATEDAVTSLAAKGPQATTEDERYTEQIK